MGDLDQYFREGITSQHVIIYKCDCKSRATVIKYLCKTSGLNFRSCTKTLNVYQNAKMPVLDTPSRIDQTTGRGFLERLTKRRQNRAATAKTPLVSRIEQLPPQLPLGLSPTIAADEKNCENRKFLDDDESVAKSRWWVFELDKIALNLLAVCIQTSSILICFF